MRKFTLLFAFLLSLVGVTQAQTVVTDLANLSNDKLYVLSTGRGTLQVNDAGDGLVAVETADNANPKQQFAVLKYSSDSYYLYHPLTQKCVSAKLLGKPYVVKDAAAVTFVAHEPGGTASGKFVMKNGDNFYNMDNDRRLLVDGWSTHDDGNGFTITEVGDYGDAEKVEGLFDWTATTAPQLSTAISPFCYVIESLRSNKFAAHTLIGSALKQTTDFIDAGAMWYFVDATDAVPDGVTLGEGVKAVYIRNLFSNLGLQSAVAATYADPGKIYYLIPHTVGDKSGFVISENTTVDGWTAWNEKNGTEVCNYSGNDAGSLWSFYPALSSVKTQAQSGIPALFDSNFQSLKNSAIAEAEAEGARPYYACSEENVNTCLATINAQTATTYEEYVTAKSNITTALSTLRATERIKPLQGGETIILENRNNPNSFLTSDAAEATATAAATLVKWGSTKDVKSLWTVVAVGDGTFKLCNALSGKYIQHQANDVQLTLTTAGEATAYEFTNQDLHYILLGAADSDTKGYYKYINWRNSNVISNWWQQDGHGNHWQVLQPSQELLNELASLQTPIDELKAAAKEEINNKTLEGINAGVEFYTITEDAFNTCKTEALALIEAATTHAELAEAKVQTQQLFDNLWTATNNRANALTAGTKVKFLNKLVNTNYMTTDANGATTSSEVTTASVWELVANNEATGYYLYNNLSGKYLKHAAEDGGQATLVAKTEATLYNVQPKGAYVVMGEVVPTSDRAYVHCDDPSNKITRYTEESDRSLWTVTSATDDEISQLNTEIQTNITTQLDAAVAAANAVVDPYKALEFYKPQAAITTYDAAIAAAKDGVDTYEELAAALEAITAAKAAFEAAVAADDVELSNTVGDDTQIKLRNRLHSEYWMSAIDGKVGMKSATDASSIWTLKAAANGGFYLLNPLTNKYVKHIDQRDTKFELVEGTEEASVYYVHPNGLYVTVGRLAELSKEEGSLEYLHGVNWNANGQWVVRWNAVGEASHWTLASVTDDEVDALNDAISVEASAQWEAYKAKAKETVDAYAALPYFTATDAAVAAYNNAVDGIGEVVTYLGLSNGKARLDEALNEFLAADRSASNNPFVNGARAKFVNRGNPTLWMTTNAKGVTADTIVGLESHWVFVENNDQTGFYMYNESADKYVKHPAQNGQQAALVATKAEASVYNVVPNGLYVNVVVKTNEELSENCLHYGAEGYVTRWLDSHNASQWNFEIVSDEDFLALAVDTLAKYKELALQKVEGATKSYYYAPTQGAADVATAAIEAVNVESSGITSYAVFKERWAAIDAALSAMYTNGKNNGRKPTDGDQIRLRNKMYPTHYLGVNENGLSHYEVVEGEGVTAFNSVESTVWELEEDEKERGRFYFKNVMTSSYAEHDFYSGWQVKLVQNKGESHPEIIELVEDQTTAEGELCFLVYTTEDVAKDSLIHASNSGAIVNGSRTEASLWVITEATEADRANMASYQAVAYHEYVFEPTLERAKRYYCITSEEVEGDTVTTTVDYIDPVKAGFYRYTGGCVDTNGDAIAEGDDEAFKEAYWYYLSNAIAMDERADTLGEHNPEVAMAAVDILNTYMKALELNCPNRNGFFRIRCVHNDMYMQSTMHDGTKLKLTGDTGTESIFYFEANENADGEGTLLSYKEGYYFTQGTGTQGYSGIYALLKGIGEKGDMFKFEEPANKEFGSYNISSDNTQDQKGRRYLFGAAGSAEGGYRLDNGGDATVVNVATDLSGSTGYNWVMERVDSIPVTISAAGWATFYAPIAMGIPEGVKAYICTGMDSNYELTLVELSEVIPAGTAVLLEGAAGTHLFIDMEHEVTAENQSTENNCLRGVLAKTWRDPSRQNLNQDMTYEEGHNIDIDYPVESGKVYTLGLEDGKVAMYRYAGNQFRHFCSYLDLPTESTAGLDVLRFGQIEGPTAIEDAPVISLEDAVIYDLSGRRVAEPGKGVYIVNGKKVYFK